MKFSGHAKNIATNVPEKTAAFCRVKSEPGAFFRVVKAGLKLFLCQHFQNDADFLRENVAFLVGQSGGIESKPVVQGQQ